MTTGRINPLRIGKMKTNLSRFRPMIAVIATVMALASKASAAPDVSTQLEPAGITLGQSAQLTITVSGDGNDAVSPPAVPGLEFVSVGQSSQFQSINGVASSTASATYEVIPQHAGTFTIPALSRGSQPLVLQVGQATETAAQRWAITPARPACRRRPRAVCPPGQQV